MGSEEEKEQALYEYQKVSLDVLKTKKDIRRKKIIVALLLLPFFFLVCRFSISYVLFPRIFPKNLRYYDIRLNNHKLYTLEEVYDDEFLFGVINMHNGGTRHFNFNEIGQKFSSKEKSYVLTLTSYSCFIPSGKRKIKIPCEEQDWKNKYMYENFDTSYKKMHILKYPYQSEGIYRLGHYYLIRDDLIGEGKWKASRVEEYSVVYEGEFASDLTYYLSGIGVYTIKIDFFYKHNQGSLYVGVVNDGESVFSLS